MNHDLSQHVFRSPKLQAVVEDAVAFFEKTPPHPLPPPERFIGSGVYALYYIGSHPLYATVAVLNRESLLHPIYVGKAVPPGTRKARSTTSETADLCRRLSEHAKSLERVVGLPPKDFRCKFMILQGPEAPLIQTVESALFRMYTPIWNVCVDGFGNHDPGSGRYKQAPSEWDVLHPGRVWAKRLKGKRPETETIIGKIRRHLGSP